MVTSAAQFGTTVVGGHVERYSRPLIGEQRDVERHVAAAADGDGQWLRGTALSQPHLQQVLVANESPIAFDAQRPGAGEHSVDLRAQQMKRRSVGGAPQRCGAPARRRFAIRAADEVADDVRTVVGGVCVQPQPGVDGFGRGGGTGGNGSLEQHQPGRVAIMKPDA